jgi:hypothetical protein
MKVGLMKVGLMQVGLMQVGLMKVGLMTMSFTGVKKSGIWIQRRSHMEGRVGVWASMTGVRGLPSGMNRSEKLPLELDLVNTSERTCFSYTFSHRSVVPSWATLFSQEAAFLATDLLPGRMMMLLT